MLLAPYLARGRPRAEPHASRDHLLVGTGVYLVAPLVGVVRVPAHDPASCGHGAAVGRETAPPHQVPRTDRRQPEGPQRIPGFRRDEGTPTPGPEDSLFMTPADRLARFCQRAGMERRVAVRPIAARRPHGRRTALLVPAHDRALAVDRATCRDQRRVAAVRAPIAVGAPAPHFAFHGERAGITPIRADRGVAARRWIGQRLCSGRRRRLCRGRRLGDRRRLRRGRPRRLRRGRRRRLRRGRRGRRYRRGRLDGRRRLRGRRRRGVLAAAAAGEEREDGERRSEGEEGAGRGHGAAAARYRARSARHAARASRCASKRRSVPASARASTRSRSRRE